MAERVLKVMTPAGEKEGLEIQVEESTERWSEVTLEDGSVFKIKATVVTAIRIPGEYDQAGFPMYVLNVSPTITIASTPDALKKQVK